MQSLGLLNQVPLLAHLSSAREAEHMGDYDLAARKLGNYWQGVGRRPNLKGVSDELGADLLLRAGALTGYLGSAAQMTGAQESALDLLTESHTAFSRLGLRDRIAEVRIELATCYRRKGAWDASRAMLDSAAKLLGADGDPYLRGLAAVRRVITESCSGELDEALRWLAEGFAAVHACESPALRGRYFNEYGAVLFYLSERNDERGEPARWGEALEKFRVARDCFEAAGHIRYSAIVENNMGYALVKCGRVAEAYKHVLKARRLALCIDDRSQFALIDDTHSQLLLEQHRLVEAEAVSRARLAEIADTDHAPLLAENLTTHAVILSRLGRNSEAVEQFARAVATAEAAGDTRGAKRVASLRESELRMGKVLPFHKAAQRSTLTFEWRTSDESLKGLNIHRYETVRFYVCEQAHDGQLAAVLTPAGRFIKLVFTEPGGRIRLEGAHPRCLVRRYLREEVQVLGVADMH